MIPQIMESVLEQSMISPCRHHSAFIRQAGSAASKNEIDESSLMEAVNLALCRLQFCTELLVIIESYIKQLWKNILHA